MRYRYLVDLRRGISVFAIFSYSIAVLGTPQCPPPYNGRLHVLGKHNNLKGLTTDHKHTKGAAQVCVCRGRN